MSDECTEQNHVKNKAFPTVLQSLYLFTDTSFFLTSKYTNSFLYKLILLLETLEFQFDMQDV